MAALMERASELCAQIRERLLVWGVPHPRPAQIVIALTELQEERRIRHLELYPRRVAITAIEMLVPPHER